MSALGPDGSTCRSGPARGEGSGRLGLRDILLGGLRIEAANGTVGHIDRHPRSKNERIGAGCGTVGQWDMMFGAPGPDAHDTLVMNTFFTFFVIFNAQYF